MNITPEEAQIALNDIQHATRTAKNVFNIWAYHMLSWGMAWTAGFLVSQFIPQWVNWIWIVLVIVACTCSGILGSIQGRRMRMVPGSQAAFLSSRLGMFYGVLYAFIILWLIIFPLNTAQTSILWITATMFGYISAGLWFRYRFYIVLGVGITIMSVIGYYLVPHYFELWCAIFAGLPLICTSIYFLISVPSSGSRKNGNAATSS